MDFKIKATVKEYYSLTKPGIIYGNIITALGGFFLASKGSIRPLLLIATLLGISLIIGSACVFNNYIDRDIDKLMARTSKRLIATGAIPVRRALIFAAVIGIMGVLALLVFVNILTLIIGLVAFFIYVVIYAVAKRRSVHGTIVGSIPGAAPVVAGYCAVSDHFNGAAVILFLILVFWQMPHFYAIAMYRVKDYAAAKIPVLPIVKGMRATKVQSLIYILGFTAANIALYVFNYVGVIYLVVMAGLGILWFLVGLKDINVTDNKWGRNMFKYSLLIIVSLSVMLSIGAIIA